MAVERAFGIKSLFVRFFYYQFDKKSLLPRAKDRYLHRKSRSAKRGGFGAGRYRIFTLTFWPYESSIVRKLC